MALFHMRRYMGDEAVEEDKSTKAENILKTLQAEAEARRLKKVQTPSKDTAASDKKEPDGDENKLVKQNEELPKELDSKQDKNQEHIKKKKNKRRHTDSFDSSDILTGSNTISTDLTAQKSDKKRKRQKEEQSKLPEKDEESTKPKSDKPKKKKQISDSAVGTTDTDVTDEEMNDFPDEEHDALASPSQVKPDEIGGFTVIGSYKKSKLQKVKRVLPDWLANPSVISSDLKKIQMPVGDMPGLDKDIVERLFQNNITHFFPESVSTGFHIGRAGYRPSDICVSAPTGSGKTLAFVLPIVQALRQRVTREVRALVVLPVHDLATQVFKVFETYTGGSDLKVGLLVGQKTFAMEQQSLVKKRLRGYQSMYDIIVATPGRLVDHINKTEGFDLTHLRFLVIDEADRVMGEIKQDWLIQVESAVYKKNSHRPQPWPLTTASCRKMELPLQKLLYSATLSSNPEKLQQLNMFQPKLFTSVVMATENINQSSQNPKDASAGIEEDTVNKNEERTDSLVRGEFVGKYTTPAGLSEFYIEATPAEKPLIVLYFLHHLKFRNVLCFTGSIEATHRLFWTIKLVGGKEVREFSSKRHSMQRDKILQEFSLGKIDIIICTDAMARGMDIENVKYVISYDPPAYIKTYVHRIGRTARAGKVGSAITFLQKKEFFHFKKMVRQSGKSNLKPMKITKKSLKLLIPDFQQALKELPNVLKKEKHPS